MHQVGRNKSIPEEYKTLDDLAQEDNEIDWHNFHQLALEGQYYNHVYHEYLAPLIQILNSDKNLNKYYKEIGNGIRDFTIIFCTKIDQCLQTTGWPFKKTASFGNLLRRLYIMVNDQETELSCLKQLWILGFRQDQWSVQKDFKEAIKQKKIKDSISIVCITNCTKS